MFSPNSAIYAKPRGHYLVLWSVRAGSFETYRDAVVPPKHVWRCMNCHREWLGEYDGHVPIVGVACQVP